MFRIAGRPMPLGETPMKVPARQASLARGSILLPGYLVNRSASETMSVRTLSYTGSGSGALRQDTADRARLSVLLICCAFVGGTAWSLALAGLRRRDL
ncbi:hypothetical protein OH76DRAFT_1028831 [Lentinus brumalis]|uniref:Uncharacterized protein n=1 Tax=Lentinus brumalis TaxID=2498619 RepID=A0A371CXQ8_9APHY|nr:hypothetical protein OH76DRAFT_1028831 [Polyporus brumalis]